MQIVDLGNSQKKINKVEIGDSFFNVIKIERPISVDSRDNIIKNANSLFILSFKSDPNIKLRGQMYSNQNQPDLIYFLGGPLVNSFEDLNNYQLKLDDFAIFDNINQFLFTHQMQLTALNDSKKISESLRNYKDQLEVSLKETQKAKDIQQSFFAKMSHELRTPLNGIIGMSKILENTTLNNDQGEYLKAISFSSNALLKIINDILDFSKLKSDKFVLNNVNFSLKELIKEVYHSFKYSANEKGLNFSYYISEDIIHCNGDSLRISQVLINLVNNAIKFTENGKVEIRIELINQDETFQEILFSVVDSGKGISKERIPFIFDIYEQEHKEITKSFGGTGLGLTIAKEIVEKYNSTIKIDSTLGVGSRFYFTLKLPNKEKLPPLIKKTKANFNLKNLRVLLVEDNEINRFYAETILKQKEVSVTNAVNGQEAVDLVRTKEFDLILMDMQMPVMNGIIATQKIRSELNNSTVILGLSANTVKEDIDKCFEVGMNGYLAKPFNPEDLFKKIEDTLDLKFTSTVKIEYSLEGVKKSAQENPALTVKMLELFITHVPTDISKMKSLIEQNEFEDVFNLAHSLKPSFGLLSIKKGTDICLSIESLKNKPLNVLELNKLHNELEELVNTISDDIKKDIKALT